MRHTQSVRVVLKSTVRDLMANPGHRAQLYFNKGFPADSSLKKQAVSAMLASGLKIISAAY